MSISDDATAPVPVQRAAEPRRLERTAARLQQRASGIPVERWLLLVGAGLLVLGLGIIVLGWYGASRTPFLFEQVPYLISGGLLGLALAVCGGFVYFGYWLTRLLQELQDQRHALERLETVLGNAAAPNGDVPTIRAASGGGAVFLATERGTMFHRPDCSVVAGREGLRPVSPNAKGMEPCRLCDPLGIDA